MQRITSFPLLWPEGWPRTPGKQRAYGRFKTDYDPARESLMKETKLLGATNLIVSSNAPIKPDLTFDVEAFYREVRANTEPRDPGVAVYFHLRGHQRVFACDTWSSYFSNLQAINKTIQALRGVERWSTSEMLTRVYDGFKVMPVGEDPLPAPWWELLKVERDAPLGKLEQAYYQQLDRWNQLMKTNYPLGKTYYEQQINFLHRAYSEAKIARTKN